MKKALILAFVATFCLSGTAQQRKGTVRKTTGTTAKTTVINFTATGELGLFDLRGSVKECVWTTKDQTRKLGFDRKGMWISEGNGKPWDNYGSVKRDSKGRIIQMGDGEESGELFTYNANGLMTKHVTVYMDGRDVATYTYNSKGECTKETFSYGDMYGSGKNVAIFTIIARDSQGNWTKRKTQKGNVETRQISYYEENTAASKTTSTPAASTEQTANDMLPAVENEIVRLTKSLQTNPNAEEYYQLANLYAFKYTNISDEAEKTQCVKEMDQIYATIISSYPQKANEAILQRGAVQNILYPDIKAGAARPYYEKYIELIETKMKFGSCNEQEKNGYLTACLYLYRYYSEIPDFKKTKVYLQKYDAMEPGNEIIRKMLNTLKDY